MLWSWHQLVGLQKEDTVEEEILRLAFLEQNDGQFQHVSF